jgi:acetylornithine deacetylase/succinyl-diaminopimelate desuccinylase-like protein
MLQQIAPFAKPLRTRAWLRARVAKRARKVAAMTSEVTDLLQHLIRNACVNDGTESSGHEVRSADLLQTYLEGDGLDIERYEPAPGRTSLVTRVEGTDPTAPTLLLMGHTDVVPANAAGWRHDPFGGELIDGEVWGRGAVDMLNLTASMAVATKRLAREGFRPKGTLVYLAVADEEALGSLGADHLVAHEADAVRADYVITESGGIPIPSPTGLKLPVIVAEKGSHWAQLRVSGTPGHGSQPYKTDNALVTAAAVVQRIAEYQPATEIHDIWRRFLEGMEYPDEVVGPLLDPGTLVDACDALPVGMARQFHACTHTTFAPTIVHGGTKINVIPDQVDLQIDIRTLPGDGEAEVRAMLDDALGDLSSKVELIASHDDPSTTSPIDTPLWDSLERVTQAFYEGSKIVPFMTVGATDARFFRRLGTTSYGFGLFSTDLSFEDYGAMFHGDDERIDVKSLELSTDMWTALSRDLLDA